MSDAVNAYARREAERRIQDTGDAPVDVKHDYYARGIAHAFDALLSDKAIWHAAEALAYDRWPEQTVIDDPEVIELMIEPARAALEAAIAAVTEGESDE